MADMAVQFTGELDLRQAIRTFQRVARKDAFNAVRKGAYEASRSLMARTKVSKPGPKIAVATNKDVTTLSERLVRAPWFRGDNVAWEKFMKGLKGKVYVARSDRPRDLGIRYRTYWERDKVSTAEIRKMTRYNMRGLAKASWRWCATKTRSWTTMDPKGEKVRIVEKIRSDCTVHADKAALRVVINNQLPYVRAALVSPSAIDEALRAAAASMRGQAKRLLAKSMEQAKLR